MEIEKREHPRWFLGSRVHRNTKREPLDFEFSPFLKAIYLDQSPELVIKKAVQIGASELLICDALSQAGQGLRVFYVLPTIDLRNLFVADRIDRALLAVPYYRQQLKNKALNDVPEIDNRGLKSFGKNGILLFVGSNSKVSFISYPADVAIIDELDKCEQQNLSFVPDRLSASPHKLMRQVSTPTIEGFGIDELYAESDRKRWFVGCEHCQEKQELDFFVNVVAQVEDNQFELKDQNWNKNSNRDIRIFCKKCGKEINRLIQGEWVAEYSGRSLSGYSISQLFSNHMSMAKIYDAFLKGLFNETKKQRFYNSILGLAYTASGSKLTKAILDECVRAGQFYTMPSRAENCTMGVDVGSVLHVWICDCPRSGFRRLVFVGIVKNFEDLYPLIHQYGVRGCVVDIEPEVREAKKFRDTAKCNVWLCDYPGRQKVKDSKPDEKEKIIQVDRTQSLDNSQEDFLLQKLLLPANAATLDSGEVYKQLCAPTRIYDEVQGRYRWEEGSKADHYRHAANYEKIASQIGILSGMPVSIGRRETANAFKDF